MHHLKKKMNINFHSEKVPSNDTAESIREWVSDRLINFFSLQTLTTNLWTFQYVRNATADCCLPAGGAEIERYIATQNDRFERVFRTCLSSVSAPPPPPLLLYVFTYSGWLSNILNPRIVAIKARASKQAVWPEKSCQLSLKSAQKWFY